MAARTAQIPRQSDLFLQCLDVLIHQGVILTLKETYTGEAMRFLQQGRVVHYGQQVPGEKSTVLVSMQAQNYNRGYPCKHLTPV